MVAGGQGRNGEQASTDVSVSVTRVTGRVSGSGPQPHEVSGPHHPDAQRGGSSSIHIKLINRQKLTSGGIREGSPARRGHQEALGAAPVPFQHVLFVITLDAYDLHIL